MSEKPQIALIVAMDLNRAIGIKGNMPWRLSADLKRFKQITMGHPVIMGRKTFESLPGGALPGRQNIVVSRNPDFRPAGVVVVDNPEEALKICENQPLVFIIGGGNLYRYFIQKADLCYFTKIHHAFEADTWFPEYNPEDFCAIDDVLITDDPKFPYPYSFVTLKKIT